MQSRREFLAVSTAVAVLPLTGCSSGSLTTYTSESLRLRDPIPADPDFASLVRYATLAPSGHNTQPWHFAPLPTGARITPDMTRRTAVVDPDDHHLFISLGCAAENFLIASAVHGRPGAMTFVDDGIGRIDIDTTSGPMRPDVLYDAIPQRQSTRSVYDGRAVSDADLLLLTAAAKEEGVELLVLTEAKHREGVLAFVLRGNDAQMEDSSFVDELRSWIRFNPTEALARPDGLFGACSGNPSIPTWIGQHAFSLLFRESAETEKYVKHIRSSSGIAVFVGARQDKDHWVRVGRSFERFALQATALGIRTAMINEAVEVPSVRTDFARWLGIQDARPDLVVRFGYAAALPMSMRRPVASIL